MKLMQEFRAFALKGNMIDLAVAVVIGGAFGKVITALVEDVVMPIVSTVLPGGDWREFTATPLNIKVGHLLGALVDFFLIALVLFIVVVKFMGAIRKAGEEEPAPTTRPCPECLETIPLKARRCRACTAVVVPA
jgi:large conductance mechanosensitive channel